MSTTIEEEPKPAGWRPAPSEPGTPSRWPLLIVIGLVLLLGISGGWPMLLVVFAIFVMVFLHELGHYLTAKWAGMKVTEFFIGIGPKIWSFTRGETEYGIKAVPVVAYVKIIGMNNLDEIEDPADEPHTYRQKSFPRRLSVAVAGSAMHMILAYLCIFGFILGEGVPAGWGTLFPDQATYERVQGQIETRPDWVIASITADSPAGQAGLQVGDKVVSLDGEPVESFDELRSLVLPRQGDTVTLGVVRAGGGFTTEVTIGRREDDPSQGFLGVGPGLPDIDYGVIGAAGKSFTELGGLAKGSVEALGRLFSPSGLSGFAGQVADGGDAGPVGEGSGGGDGGSEAPEDRPVSIVGAARLGADMTRGGVINVLFFLAILNMFVGIFNMIPLLPLDGGHVAVAVYERIRSRKGRRYQADVAKLLPLTYAVVLLLIFVGVASLYLDILDPINLN